MHASAGARVGLAGALCAAALGIVGCSAGTHQVIDQVDACLSCHSGKQTYEVAASEKAVTVSTSLTVSTKASDVYVCTVEFAMEDGSFWVPRSWKRVAVENGEAHLELSEGTWVLSAGEDAGSTQALVVATAGADTASIEL